MKNKDLHIHDHHISREWEDACTRSRRNLWLRKRRLSMFHIKKRDRVLDLGCGDGLNIALLRTMGITNIVGLDMSRNLVRQAEINNPGIKFYVGLAEKLPFKNSQFTIVLVDSVFHHLMEYPQHITEIKRVLAPDGLLCFVEPHQMTLRSILDFVSTLPITRYIPVLNERSKGYLGERALMRHWLDTENEFLRLLEKNGLKKIFCKRDLLSVVGQYQKN